MEIPRSGHIENHEQPPRRNGPDHIYGYLYVGYHMTIAENFTNNKSAVHNFCTSQKAVSHPGSGAIGSAQRGGKQIINYSVKI